MKNIIVPTDFSACAKNAIHYAITLAQQFKAKLHVVYVHHPDVIVQAEPIIENNLQMIPVPLPDNVRKEMNELEEELSHYQGLVFKCYIEKGLLDEILIELSESKKEGLVVMGTKGAHDPLDLWANSNTSKVIERKKIQVLSVPETFNFKPSANPEFVMATDFEPINDWSVMDGFYELALKLKANINVFYVRDNSLEDDRLIHEKEVFAELVKFFEGLKVSLHHSDKDNVVTAVDEFARHKNASLIMMVAHEHSWLDELFHHSVTKDMALHSHVPLLTIPDAHAELNRSYSTNYW